MKKLFQILLLFVFAVACGEEENSSFIEYKNIENIKAEETIVLTKIEDGKFYNPKFTVSGNKVVFTTETFTGLWYYDFNTKVVNQLNPSIGAGINFDISKVDEKVYFRLQSTSAKGNLRNYSIAEQDIESKKINILYTSANYLSEPKALADGNIAFCMNDEIKVLNKETKNFIENYEPQNIIAFGNGNKIIIEFRKIIKEISPAGDNKILWVETSAANDKIYFNCEEKGTGVYAIESNEINWIDNYKYFSASGNSNLIAYSLFQSDTLNYNYDLFISSEGSHAKFKITNTPGEVEMFPYWSNDCGSVIYNTAEGIIKLTKIKIKSGSNV